MKIMMTKTAAGISREDGAETIRYQAGTEYEATATWQKKVFQGFVKMGMANEIGGNAGPTETKAKRGRPKKTAAKK